MTLPEPSPSTSSRQTPTSSPADAAGRLSGTSEDACSTSDALGSRDRALPGDVSSGTGFLWLNTRTAPFDSILARQALNYAVNRAALAGIARGTSLGGRVTCQLLPPNFPGYIPYCPYTVAPSTPVAGSLPT
jgi:ABC-type transport system substrate-binding protein